MDFDRLGPMFRSLNYISREYQMNADQPGRNFKFVDRDLPEICCSLVRHAFTSLSACPYFREERTIMSKSKSCSKVCERQYSAAEHFHYQLEVVPRLRRHFLLR